MCLSIRLLAVHAFISLSPFVAIVHTNEHLKFYFRVRFALASIEELAGSLHLVK